ncbi:DNA mismatch repair protein PMS2 [Nematocida sp. AWRm78]|nr:DNA mismatch repair protein PMS2 [Nematocida sp. AWRm78]
MIKILSNEDSAIIQTEQILPDIHRLIKEMIHNSIDAQATSITITICTVDKSIVYLIEDNGTGIEVNEYFLMKGGTSKYGKNNMYGYKGLTLYSLKLVSDFSINTNYNGMKKLINAKNREVSVMQGYKDSKGTTISISSYYALNPIRYNYLLTNLNKNIQYIVEDIRKYNTVHNIQFKLYKNQSILYNTPYSIANKPLSITERIIQIYNIPNSVRIVFKGKYFILECIIEKEDGKGARSNKKEKKIQGVIHNKSRILEKSSVEKAVQSGLNIPNRMFYNLEILEDKEITILSEISRIGKYSIEEVLAENEKNQPPVIFNLTDENNESASQQSAGIGNSARIIKKAKQEEAENKIPAADLEKEEIVSKKSSNTREDIITLEKDSNSQINESECNVSEIHENPHSKVKDERIQAIVIDKNECLTTHTYESGIGLTIEELAKLVIVGQFNNGFIICTLVKEGNIHMYIIDQHAADEAVNYEQLRSTVVYKKQKLIQPMKVNLTEYDMHVIRENMEYVKRNGFGLNAELTELIEVPSYEDRIYGENELLEVIESIKEDNIEEGKHIIFTELRRLLASKACRSSIMIGDVLNMQQMNKIVSSLSKTTRPWNCPHGRPTIILLQNRRNRIFK